MSIFVRTREITSSVNSTVPACPPRSGVRTPDLGGHAGTTEFTDEVISRVRTKIDIWASL